MARYTGPSCKLCRREGKKLFLKGDRCLTDKCAVARRATVPGQHGAGRKSVKEYGQHLREKQTARRYYGVQEKQFKKYYVAADSQEGIAGENLLSLLERRFDNVVYRMGMASSRKEARQLVRHAHFTLNGKKADIPSIILKVGDVVTVKDAAGSKEFANRSVEAATGAQLPQWMSFDKATLRAEVIAVPTREQIAPIVDEQAIVELYSR